MRPHSLLAIPLFLGGCMGVVGDEASELASSIDDHHGDGMCMGYKPLLSVPDFDGNGRVTPADVRLVSAARRPEEYVAFFDTNADGALNGKDVSRTARSMGRRSRPLDQEIAAVFWATERYRDIKVAIAEGFAPLTEELRGHGIHYANYFDGRIDGNFEVARPEGLNYDTKGRLLNVFYYMPGAVELNLLDPSVPPGVFSERPPREGFSPDFSLEG